VICPETRDRLPAYLDDELDAARRAAFEEHLHGCSECGRELASLRALRGGLRDDSFRYTAPAGLKERIRSGLRPAVVRTPRSPIPFWLTTAAALLVGVALGASGMYLAADKSAGPDADLPRELTAAHVRSLLPEDLPEHLYDVKSTDRHTVKPWFQGRVDFTPPVKDFKDQGYPLEGGRLDYPPDRAVAALVYTRNKHIINLFIWPAAGADNGVQATTRRGFNLLHWTQDGLNFWAVSDLNAEELAEFARLQRESGR